MKGINRVISLTLSFALVVTTVCSGAGSFVFANETGADEMEPILVKVEEEEKSTETVIEKAAEVPIILTDDDAIGMDTTYVRDEETGYISMNRDNNVLAYEEDESMYLRRDGASATDSSYPTSDPYNAVKAKYPATRNQNPYGTCWAFASVACAEFDLINDGVLNNQNNWANFSEMQLVYNMYHTGNDRLGNLDGDTISLADDAEYDFLNIGGNPFYAQNVLANWRGLMHEDVMPYTEAANLLYNPLNLTFGSSEAWYSYHNNMARLENSRNLDIHANPKAVKQAIIDNGAVYASYYSDSAGANGYYALYNGYATYYCPYYVQSDHAITIVGWNDNFSIYNFPEYNRPSYNGAWLVRNSWSTENNGSNQCYFWLSYADNSLVDSVYTFDFGQGANGYTSDNNYDVMYQHDGAIMHYDVYAHKVANIFTTSKKSNSTTNVDGYASEVLEAVMLPVTYETGANYKIEIYTGLTDSSNPESGILHSKATTYASTTFSGVYTFKLNRPVYLAPGEKYSIVVTENSNATDRLSFDVEHDAVVSGWYKTDASVDAGESFFSYGNGWTDIYYSQSSGYGNICIKGLTNNSSAKKYFVHYNLNGGKNSSSNPSYYLSTSGTTSLKSPSRSGYHFLGWYTDSSYKNKITSISGSIGKNLTLYAKWGAHDFSKEDVKTKATMTKDGWLDMKCTGCSAVESYYILHPTSAKLSYKKTTYSNSYKRPAVTVKTENGTLSSSLYTVTYSNHKKVGRAKAVIKLPSKYYTGSLTRYFSIVPKAPKTAKARLYGYNDIKVTWSKCTGADGYYVYWKKANGSYTTKKRVRTTKLYYNFKNFNANTKYSFKIVPFFKSGDTRYTSIKTNIKSATTLKKVVQKSGKRLSSTKVKVRWYDLKGESGYQIKRAKTKNGTYKVVAKNVTKNYKTLKVKSGKKYWYKVRAFKTVTVNGKKVKIFGPWSSAKKI